MNLSQTLFFSATIVLLLIGIHQSYINGFAQSYWIFMLVIILMGFYQFNKKRYSGQEPETTKPFENKRTTNKKRKRKK